MYIEMEEVKRPRGRPKNEDPEHRRKYIREWQRNKYDKTTLLKNQLCPLKNKYEINPDDIDRYGEDLVHIKRLQDLIEKMGVKKFEELVLIYDQVNFEPKI
jgi:hypothetical protein